MVTAESLSSLDPESPLLPLITLLALVLAFSLIQKEGRRTLETWIAKFNLLLTLPEEYDGPDPTVSGLFIHPVKSLRAVAVKEAAIDELGFVNDRRLMLVVPAPPPIHGQFLRADPSHKFLTQRQCPILATITAKWIAKDLLSLTCGKKSMTVHTIYDARAAPQLKARLWGQTVLVQDMGQVVASFLQELVGDDPQVKGIRLAQMVSPCPVKDKYVPPAARTVIGTTPHVALTDGFPVLIASEASLAELNRRLRENGKPAIPMSRFRPNVVIKGTKPFEEDTWKVIQIGGAKFHIVKGCPRCKQSCTDQTTGTVSEEPLATLADFRNLGNDKSEVYFAQNAIVYGASVSIGDKVRVLKRGDPVWDLDKVQAE